MAVAMSAFSLWMTGCAGKDSAVFVTTTNIGIDADARPPHATIGYDRYEGYIGPAYANGAIPPVYSKIESNLEIFNPEVRQMYATGDAARIVTKQAEAQGETGGDEEPELLVGDSRVMLFGTGSNIGLRVTFAGNVPESLSLGYKRKEFSYIPLGIVEEEHPKGSGNMVQVHKYGSVLASMDMGVHTETFRDTGISIIQFFATGDAAKNLARIPAIQNRFVSEARQSMLVSEECRDAYDDASAKLDDALANKPGFDLKLTGWLTQAGISTNPDMFIICDTYAAQRQNAVNDPALMSP
jgi:hypothetical protein